MQDPYLPSSSDYNPTTKDYEHPFQSGMHIVGIDAKQVTELKYGQRIRFSGDLALVDNLESVKNANYELLEDAFAIPMPTAEELKDLLITLRRSQCFGTCPDYTLTITGDGTVTFDGRYYTKAGTATVTIDQEKVIELIREVQKADFFNLSDDYSANVTDIPTYFVSVGLGGKSKQVRDYGAGPPRLRILENRIDQIVNSAQWIR
jgi:hypothetical protein